MTFYTTAFKSQYKWNYAPITQDGAAPYLSIAVRTFLHDM